MNAAKGGWGIINHCRRQNACLRPIKLRIGALRQLVATARRKWSIAGTLNPL
ncbi:hypothetical protein [Methylomonas fluvii]|nr:hypothetical protein [Methylomonas fluvii]